MVSAIQWSSLDAEPSASRTLSSPSSMGSSGSGWGYTMRPPKSFCLCSLTPQSVSHHPLISRRKANHRGSSATLNLLLFQPDPPGVHAGPRSHSNRPIRNRRSSFDHRNTFFHFIAHLLSIQKPQPTRTRSGNSSFSSTGYASFSASRNVHIIVRHLALVLRNVSMFAFHAETKT